MIEDKKIGSFIAVALSSVTLFMVLTLIMIYVSTKNICEILIRVNHLTEIVEHNNNSLPCR